MIQIKFDLKDFLLNVKILRHVSEFPQYSGHHTVDIRLEDSMKESLSLS